MKFGIELMERYCSSSAGWSRKYRMPPIKFFDEYKDPSHCGIFDVVGFLTQNTWLEITEVDDLLKVRVNLKLRSGNIATVERQLRRIPGQNIDPTSAHQWVLALSRNLLEENLN